MAEKRRIKATYASFADPPDLEYWNLNSLNLKLGARAANEALATLLKNSAYIYFSEMDGDPLSLTLGIEGTDFEFCWTLSLKEAMAILREHLDDGDDISATVKALSETVADLVAAWKKKQEGAQ